MDQNKLMHQPPRLHGITTWKITPRLRLLRSWALVQKLFVCLKRPAFRVRSSSFRKNDSQRVSAEQFLLTALPRDAFCGSHSPDSSAIERLLLKAQLITSPITCASDGTSTLATAIPSAACWGRQNWARNRSTPEALQVA